MKVGTWIFDRLYDAGCHAIFGVPGDFNLALLNQGLKSRCQYVGTCNELNAAYAADGYARIQGLGALITTYAVGELSAANGVAGAFAESIPVVHIVGAPAMRHFQNKPLLHHTLGDYHIPMNMYKNITAANAFLSSPNMVAREVDRILNVALTQHKPVYLLVPSDIAATEMPSPETLPEFKLKPIPPSNNDALDEAIEEICRHVADAHFPVLMPGVALVRQKLDKEFQELVEKTQIPFATMLLVKGILDETHPRFIGLYSGDRSRPEVLKQIQKADCIVVFGERFTDFNTGGFTANLTAKNSIYVGDTFVRVNNHYYPDVYIEDVIRALIAKLPAPSKNIEIVEAKDSCTHRPGLTFDVKSQEKINMNGFFKRMATFFKEGSVVMAETGASLFSAAETRLANRGQFMSQTFYGSIGYTIGGALGASYALKKTGRDFILFVGDGSFQVTCQDLSTMIRHGCDAYVFIINNDGYTIERCICDNTYNDIQMWNYADLPEIFGGKKGYKVHTEGELEAALVDAEKNRKGEVKVFEIFLERMDCNELLKAAGKTMAKNNDIDPEHL